MAERNRGPEPIPAKPESRFSGFGMAVAAVLLIAIAAWGFYRYFPSRLPPAQPIPFSHRVHATDKRIGCFLCHEGAKDSARAGIPPLETCLLCHKRIIVDYPWIRELRRYYDAGRPVAWVRVNGLPEFVYFVHSVHVLKGFDCGVCHGDVARTDRLGPARKFQMGFCVQCHRDNNATHDCFTCHR